MIFKTFAVFLSSLFLMSCARVPETINPVTEFDLNRYSGKWYEIARLDHRFERGLEKVTATYSLNIDGTIRVKNRGFSTKGKKWKEAIGKAKFNGDESVGHLKVSFFGPFYGSYIIFHIDKENYQYSFVTSGENYLWLLSRTPKVSEAIKENFLSLVQDAGYNTEELIFVKQE